MRYGIFVFDPDGDMGYGRVVGAYRSPERAELKTDALYRAAERDGREIQCVVVPLVANSTSAAEIVRSVF